MVDIRIVSSTPSTRRQHKILTLRYGFKNFDGVVKKLLKVVLVSKPDHPVTVEELYAIQHDNKFFHTPLNSQQGETKRSRKHPQLERPELLCDPHGKKRPEIIDNPLPEWHDFNYPYAILTVPLHCEAAQSRNIYNRMKQQEIRQHAGRIIDLSKIPDMEYVGNLSIYLLPPDFTYNKFERWTPKAFADLYLLDIYDGCVPRIGGFFYIRIAKGLRGCPGIASSR